MYAIVYELFGLVFFFSFASILITFFWDYKRVPGWLFLVCSAVGYYLLRHNGVLKYIFPFISFPKGMTYTICAVVLAFVFLAVLVRAPFPLLLYAISTTLLYSFFIAGMEFWEPVDSNYTYEYMLWTGIMYAVSSFFICLFVRRSFVPLFRICKDKKLLYKLSIPPFLGAVGFFLLFMNAKVLGIYPLTYYVAAVVLYITCVANNIANAQNIQTTIKATKYESDLKHSRELLDMQKEYYQELAGSIEESRIARHDLRHHMHTISNLVEKEDYETLRDYLLQYDNNLSSTIYYTGNPPVDAILTHYLNLAKEENIRVTHSNLALPAHCTIKDIDLTVIFGNLIENAIEASLALPIEQRHINLSVASQGDLLTMVFENAFDGSVTVHNNQYLSNKREQKSPGIGLTSLRRVVEDYHGEMEISSSDHLFTVKLFLQNL